MSNMPLPYGPTPSARQLAWHRLETTAFVHFTTNTFTDKEWGYGDESPEVFNPTAFDADQIAETARDAGLKGLILTAKHHDGFCLWPSRYTDHSVKASPFRGGKGDAVREVSEACARAGLLFGVYLSPWDRNHKYYASQYYVAYYLSQLEELCSDYGPLFEVWFDGANGGDGYYGGAREQRQIDASTYYEWNQVRQLVRRLQPDACMFGDGGPDIRWVGNEEGWAGDPCWATLNPADFYPGHADLSRLQKGDRPGTDWLPAEVDVSIRPGWFYHASEDARVKTSEQLLDIYYASVGRGCNLLLNLPPDGRGLIHEADAQSLRGWRKALDETFATDLAQGAKLTASNVRGGSSDFAAEKVLDSSSDTYWSTDDAVTSAELMLDFERPVEARVVRLREHLPLGQRVEQFALDAWDGGFWRQLAEGQSLGSQRLIRLEKPVTTPRLRLRLSGPVCPALEEVGVF